MQVQRSAIVSAAVLVASLALSTNAAAQANVIPQANVLDFDTMAGVMAPYTGAANPIRGVPGGGLPWELDRVNGMLRASGEIHIDVRGLVLARRDPVPLERQGTNPAATFRAIVSCETFVESEDELGTITRIPTTVNSMTAEFPASPNGDARIRETLEIPSPCFAPVVFVTNAGGSWFSVTGFESVRQAAPPNR